MANHDLLAEKEKTELTLSHHVRRLDRTQVLLVIVKKMALQELGALHRLSCWKQLLSPFLSDRPHFKLEWSTANISLSSRIEFINEVVLNVISEGFGMSEGYTKVGQVNDFPAGKLKKVQVAKEDVVVANIDGKIYAMTATCTHRGGPLDEGELEGTTVICPYHGGQFDITTGKVVAPPPMKDEVSFEVKIEGTDVLLKKK
jgi:nitrite reductase (NADH) small subunit/3-phenylpropionate/trans-cinnamate dioxygenase ferredoxin subunit